MNILTAGTAPAPPHPVAPLRTLTSCSRSPGRWGPVGRGTASAHAPTCLHMLWGGLDIQANGTIRLRDEELASLRPARRFTQLLEDEVPKTPAEIEQHLRYYSLTDTHLPLAEFDRLLFTGVYCAYQVRSMQGLDKNLWIRFFSQLIDEIFRDLCKGLCPANTTLLLASWPWEEKPSHLAPLKHFYRSNLARTKRDNKGNYCRKGHT
ncbi:protein FAM180B isoform X1 [Tyto alba]|uniref:protein FAM180B isoform X1 n=1 Tax=Tyto alba TaxID=56313 RepID=UPI001402DF1D|nr:protein FAM180B isoform X1 [Tyto alba]